MKRDIKLCANLFNVVNLPVSFPLGQGHPLGTCMAC